jgi:hypothetical protein
MTKQDLLVGDGLKQCAELVHGLPFENDACRHFDGMDTIKWVRNTLFANHDARACKILERPLNTRRVGLQSTSTTLPDDRRHAKLRNQP